MENKMINEYLDGKRTKDLLKKYDITSYKFYKILKDNNITLIGSGRRNNYPNVFKHKSNQTDYWLGYIFADGHLSYKRRSYFIYLSSVQKEVINAFNSFTLNNCKIYEDIYETSKGINSCYKAILYDKDIAFYFKNVIGIDENKVRNLNPNIELNWDIIRGFFDGDGSAHKVRGWSITSSSLIWILRIKNFLLKEGISKIKINKYLNAYKVCVWDKEELKILIPKMYANTENTFYNQNKRLLLNRGIGIYQ